MTSRRDLVARSSANAFRRVRADHQAEIAADYVELIADLIEEANEARGSDIARRLGVTSATVAKTMRRLQDAGLITQEPYSSIFLTAAGQQMADQGRRKHQMVREFLLALGVSAVTAGIDSEGIEHHVSQETLGAMAEFLSRNKSGR